MERDFASLADVAWSAGKHLCVGLDVDLAKIPRHIGGDDPSRAFLFAREIIDATADLVSAYKPNSAFFEALGGQGSFVLHEIVQHIHLVAPTVPVIIDAKRADIANSNFGTTSYLFDFLGADATTVQPYLGHEALRPFLERRDKGIFVLCRTSNSGAGELQDLEIAGEPLFLRVASLVGSDWNENHNCGLVVGATYPAELSTIRSRVPDLPLLIPGIGAQGGDLEATVRAAHSANGLRAFINVSRSVIYASPDEDFATAARSAALETDNGIRSVVAALA